jgi:Histidine kinase-, DNA gyrase B-, and HSP90-like ATPase
MSPYTPRVKEAHAFREISMDFTKPEEIFREAIANSLDAYARRIWLRISVEGRRGRETVLIDISDDGTGMNVKGVEAFLNLSDSIKADAPPAGKSRRRMSGYKGHGTKIYYNSEQFEVLTYDGITCPVYCRLQDPRGDLAEKKV